MLIRHHATTPTPITDRLLSDWLGLQTSTNKMVVVVESAARYVESSRMELRLNLGTTYSQNRWIKLWVPVDSSLPKHSLFCEYASLPANSPCRAELAIPTEVHGEQCRPVFFEPPADAFAAIKISIAQDRADHA